MDFENLDLQSVLDDLADSGLSVSEAGDRLSSSEVSDYTSLGESLDSVGIVILDGTASEGTGLRNLAQTVKDSPETADAVETVIVRAPHNTQVVSDSMSRFQIESNQGELHGSLAPQDIDDFLEAAAASDPDFTALNVLVLVGVLITVAVAAGFARLMYR